MSVLWFVKSGPDASHIFDVAAFDMLRDAKAFAESLPVTPTGLKRPYEIWRHEYFDHKRFGNTVNARMVTPNNLLSRNYRNKIYMSKVAKSNESLCDWLGSYRT